MIKKTITIAAVLTGALWTSARGPLFAKDPARSLTLADCYAKVLKQSEVLLQQEERILQFQQRTRQAMSAILPDVDFVFTEFWQDTTGTSSDSGVGSTLVRGERPEAKIRVRQRLFGGFREFNAVEGLKSERKRQEYILKRAKINIYQDLANVFYLVFQLEKDLENTRNILNLSRVRIRDLRSRVRLGKSRRSEVLSAESQLATLQGQKESLLGQMRLAREALSLLVGEDMQGVLLMDQIPPVKTIEPLDGFIGKSSSRSDLLALNQDLETKKRTLKVARGELYPTVSLAGNYYLKRVGFQEPIDWDLELSLTVPLFKGGSNLAGIKIRASEYREAELEYRRAKRNIESFVRTSHIQLQTALAQLAAYEMAFKRAERSYRLQVEEYRYGLVNNLEVLQALNTLQEAKKNLDHTLVEAKLNYLALRVAAEDLTSP